MYWRLAKWGAVALVVASLAAWGGIEHSLRLKCKIEQERLVAGIANNRADANERAAVTITTALEEGNREFNKIEEDFNEKAKRVYEAPAGDCISDELWDALGVRTDSDDTSTAPAPMSTP